MRILISNSAVARDTPASLVDARRIRIILTLRFSGTTPGKVP
jgi:hypothetical protein